jgi:hypothetical protein
MCIAYIGQTDRLIQPKIDLARARASVGRVLGLLTPPNRTGSVSDRLGC